MSIDTLGYVKRLEAAGFKREQAEAHAEALRDELVPQLATTADVERLGDRIETAIAKMEGALWKHTVGVLLGVLAVGGLLLRITQ